MISAFCSNHSTHSEQGFRRNIVFEGKTFSMVLPISYAAKAGRYTVKAEHVITGMQAQTCFDIIEE